MNSDYRIILTKCNYEVYMENILHKDDFHKKTQQINTLFQFIKNKKEDQFVEYLSNLTHEEVDVNMKDENGNYLISFAIIMNNRRILKKLIEYGSRLDIIDSEGYSILYYPIKFNYSEIIDILLEFDKKTVGISLVNIKDARGAVPLFYAIKYRNRYALQELLSNGADANYKNNEKMNALHLAVLKKDITMVRILSNYIKNLNARTSKGTTALHYACNFQLLEIVKFLLEKGADQNIIEIDYDFYPIFYSVVQNNVEITKALVDNGANPNHQDYMGNTIIHYCIIDNHIEILDYIMEKSVIKTIDTNTYIEDINKKEDLEINHIDPNIMNIDGLTIVHLMFYYFKNDYIKYLNRLIPYSNLNYQDNSGNTVLHIIIEKNLWDTFQELLSLKKLNIFIKNNNGHTVLDTVNLGNRDKFLDVIAKSYLNYLKKYNQGWLLEWQNNCSNLDNNEATCFNQIREFIIREKVSIPLKKSKKQITIVNDQEVTFSTFTGSLLDMICGFKYLTKKYPDATSLFHLNQEDNPELDKYNQSLGIQDNPNQQVIYFEIRWIYQRIFLPPRFEDIMSNIINSKKYKYIIVPIGIILSNGNHSNGLFYDIKNNIMERFEPHGSDYPTQFNYNPDLLDEVLYKKISNVMNSIYGKSIEIKYYQPRKYLPKIGFQTFESIEANVNKNIGDPNGFCTLWTIWYFDYRLKYHDRHPRSISKNLIKEIKTKNYSFRTIIRNYSKHITDLRDHYLSLINRNVNDYLNNKLSKEEIKKLLVEILSD